MTTDFEYGCFDRAPCKRDDIFEKVNTDFVRFYAPR